MTLALFAAAALAATPRPLPSADSAIYVPRLDRIEGLVAFMARAGQRSAMMRPSTWFSEFHPLLATDFTRRESLREAGIDPAGSVTVSWRGEGRMSCVDLADPKAFEAAARQKLALLGTVWDGKVKGAPVVAAKSASGVLVAGYARKGNASCAVASTRDARPLLEAAFRAASKPAAAAPPAGLKGLAGSAFVVTERGVAGVDGTASALQMDARGSLPAAKLAKGGQSPYAAPGGSLLSMRGLVAKESIPAAVSALTASLASQCPSCGRAQLQALEAAIAPRLTGHVAFRVNALNVRGRLRTSADQFFAAQHAWLAEVDDPSAASRALGAAKALPGARATGAGYAVSVPGGEISLGVQGRHLFVANDSTALKAALDAIPANASPMAHGAELALDPAKAARALLSISMMDMFGSKELAGLFALGAEIGPLLSMSESVRAHLDSLPDGKHRAHLTWTLSPAPRP